MFMTQNMLYFVNVLCAPEKKNVFYCFWRREYYININQVKLVDGGVHVFYILLILCLIVLCYCKEKLKSFSYNIGLSISLFNFISVCSMFFKIQKVFVYVLNLQAFKIVLSPIYIDPILVMKCPPLLLVTLLYLKLIQLF